MSINSGSIVLKDARGLTMLQADTLDRSPVPDDEPRDARPFEMHPAPPSKPAFDAKAPLGTGRRWSLSLRRSFRI